MGDLVEALFPALDDYDLDTILTQLAPEVATRKVLIVGHSQGAQYANALYQYLTAHGEPAGSVGVYAVATPASSVAGGGSYRTYVSDLAINSLRGAPLFNPLPANLTFVDPYPDDASAWPGHSFSGAYLAAASDTIVGDIRGALAGLSAGSATTSDCFEPPPLGASHVAQAVLFNSGDALSAGLLEAGEATVNAAHAVGQAASVVAAGAGAAAQKVVDDIGVTVGGLNGLAHANEPQYNLTNFEIVSKLYGSSLTPQEYEEYFGSGQSDQSGAVALAIPTQSSAPQPPVQQSISIPDVPAVPIGPTPGVSPGGSGQGYAPSQSAPDVVTVPETDVSSSEEASTTDDVTTDEGVATSTDATSSPPVPASSSGSPVVDSFDSFSGWSLVGYANSAGFTFDDGSDGQCHAGGCITIASTTSSNVIARDFKSGVPLADGSFTFWARFANPSPERFAGPLIEWCAGDPVLEDCDFWNNFAPKDDVWHQYYVAWRDNDTLDIKELCKLSGDTDSADCSWQPSEAFALGDLVDTIMLTTSNAGRYDLGDTVWFDDLGE